MTETHRECSRCLLDTGDEAHLSFDENGVCDYCRSFDEAWVAIPTTERESEALLSPILDRLKTAGRNRRYDCLLGVSGGVDSTYLALLLKRWGVHPLVVHFDNGWNSELAVANIENLIRKLDFDLETYVVDWHDFRALQLAYLRASVVDIEVLTDHAIYGAMYSIARKHAIRYVISGVNVATEFVLPGSWNYDKLDDVNIKSIYRQYGTSKLTTYPFVDRRVRRSIKKSGIKTLRLLDLIVYDLSTAKREIETQLGWRPYEGKHFESVFTRFYQGYILPTKFGINKRKAHLSNLICSGQLTKEAALRELGKNIYSEEQASQDLAFVLKKLELSRQEFDDIMSLPARKHTEFDQIGSFFSRFPLATPLRPIWNRVRPLFKKPSTSG